MEEQDRLDRMDLSKSHKRHHPLLKQQIRLRRRKTPEGKDRYEIVPVPDTLSFEKGFFLFIRAVQLLAQENEGVILVGLAGPSGAGKTVFSEKVVSFMPGISLISMDNYNVASRVIDSNFDDPRITDYDLLLENINSLRNGQPAEIPIYDFKTSSRVGFRTVPVPASRIVIVEGIYALSERLRPCLDLRVSITGGVHFDLVKRVLRDIDRSGQAPEEIIAQISETVYPMYKAFIEPDLETAHLRVVNKFNPFSGFQNPTYVLKAPADMGEEVVRGALGPEHKETVEETYDIYLLPPGEDKETCVSYLRMRNRDGRYSLMFEEWVTDGPFVITPRITFEVSVRLLGGLMALGYEMAHIIKRSSRVFKDPDSAITVKLDHLEQLSRDYVQVQGKDRAKVKEVAVKLGLEGKYIAKPYIEQILLENLTKEVQAPKMSKKELKERFLVSEDLLTVSPGGETLVTPRTSQASSWNENQGFLRAAKSRGYGLTHEQAHYLEGTHIMSPDSNASERGMASGRSAGRLGISESSDRRGSRRSTHSAIGPPELAVPELHGIVDRLDELLTRMDGMEARMAHPAGTPRAVDAPPPTPAIPTPSPAIGASNSALSNQISAALHTGGTASANVAQANGLHASPVLGALSLAHNGGGGGNGVPRAGPGGEGNGPPQLSDRQSFELARGYTSVVEFLEEVRMLSRNQSRMADELESLNGMLKQTLEKDVLGLGSGGGRGASQGIWRLEAIMTASAVVSLACASALVFTFLSTRSSSR